MDGSGWDFSGVKKKQQQNKHWNFFLRFHPRDAGWLWLQSGEAVVSQSGNNSVFYQQVDSWHRLPVKIIKVGSLRACQNMATLHFLEDTLLKPSKHRHTHTLTHTDTDTQTP